MNKPEITDEADFQVGPTDQGMVRFIVTTNDQIINLDFSPEEAREICEEIEAAGVRASEVPNKR